MNKEGRQLSLVSAKSSGRGSRLEVYHVDGGKPKRDQKDITCYCCQKKGHYQNECKEEVESVKKDATAAMAVGTEYSDLDELAW